MMLGKTVRKRKEFLSFAREEGSNVLRPVSYFNCDFRDGKLKGGLGIKPLVDSNGNPISVTFNGQLAGVYFALINEGGGQEDSLMTFLVDADDKLYRYNADSGTAMPLVYLGKGIKQSAFRGEDRSIYNIFSGNSRAVATKDGSYFSTVFSGNLLGCCVCGKRYFVLHANGELFYSAPFVPHPKGSEDVDGEGTLYLPAGYGEGRGMAEYGGKVYIFLQRGIFKLTVSAKATDFTMEKIPYAGGEICLDSMSVIQKGVAFLALDGVYLATERGVERLCEDLRSLPYADTERCFVGRADGMAIIEYAVNEEGESVKKRIAVDGDGRWYETERIGSFSGDECVVFNGDVCRYTAFGEDVQWANEPYFTSEGLDFGTRKNKRLKTLRLRGKGTVKVQVNCGEKKRTYSLVCRGGSAETRLLEKGKVFSFTLFPCEDTVVESMEIEYCEEK
nr:hypothetical protein [Clostridia bacterium]